MAGADKPAMAPGDTMASPAAAPRPKIIHPIWVRATHWINAFAILLMVTSGWQIYNASPIFSFLPKFPVELTLGKWLAGARDWHFAAMWILVINGVVYLTLGVATGRLRMKLLPISIGAFFADSFAALTGKLSHADLSVYNAVQKVLYLGVILLGIIVVLSGLSIWKPVQFQELTGAFGGYDVARIIHFLAMAGIVGFVVIHVAVALLVPKSLLAMIRGR
jgi:thiosulfate reductase cytochrome b subunit